ncbi:MAG: hypothetical protein JW717_02195 [Marinilabiliaceae bacterium]|nr:hypothetical protein [Marinilabiliaceae bacterium]
MIKRCTNGSFNIYNNNTGTLISSVSSQYFDGELGYPYHACFIKNTDDKIAVVFYFKTSKPLPKVLGLFDKDGKLLQIQNIGREFAKVKIDCIYSSPDILTIFYDDLEVAKLNVHF